MNLAENLWNSAERFPERPAIRFYDRDISYRELRDLTAAVAGGLAKLGVGRDSVVGIALPNVPEFVTAYYAIIALGAKVMSMNPLYTTHELTFMAEDARPNLLITHPLIEKSPRELAAARNIPLLYSDSLGDPAKRTIHDAAREAEPVAGPVDLPEDTTAVIVYTNAVDGTPLGAELTHGGLEFDTATCVQASDMRETDALLALIPLYHAFAATTLMHLTIRQGSLQVQHELFNEARALKSLRDDAITVFPAVPAIFRKLVDKLDGGTISLPAMRGPVPGGSAPPPGLLEEIERAFGTLVFEGYGITECGPVTTVNPIVERVRKLGTIGKPLGGISVKIVDGDDREVPGGVAGELCVSGKNVMKGYLNREEETRRHLRGGWFHTGDLASIDEDGYITITGRKKRMIIVGGLNVYPAEVEKALATHPDVAEFEIYGGTDPVMTEKVCARIALKKGAERDKVGIQRYLRRFLAPYKIPRTIEFDET